MNVDERFKLAIPRVEVSSFMLAPVHADGDSEEDAYRGDSAWMRGSLRIILEQMDRLWVRDPWATPVKTFDRGRGAGESDDVREDEDSPEAADGVLMDFVREVAPLLPGYADGNVINIGSMKLQVVEACNGLRYLFPLMTLASVCAHFFHAAWWKKAVLFFSSLPIRLLMNNLRIAIIAVMAECRG